MKKINPIAERSKQWMAQSLLDLMEKKDYRSISIQEICAGASLARQTFYSNFSSKEDILSYYLDALFEEFKQGVLEDHPQSSFEFIRAIFVFCKEHATLSSLLWQNQLSHLVWERLTINNESLWELFVLHGDSPDREQEQYTVSFFAGALYGLASAWFATGMQRPPEEMAQLTLELMHTSFPI